nr:MAG TPA: hypothetical protein [Caudoviricetes sp.]
MEPLTCCCNVYLSLTPEGVQLFYPVKWHFFDQ